MTPWLCMLSLEVFGPNTCCNYMFPTYPLLICNRQFEPPVCCSCLDRTISTWSKADGSVDCGGPCKELNKIHFIKIKTLLGTYLVGFQIKLFPYIFAAKIWRIFSMGMLWKIIWNGKKNWEETQTKLTMVGYS